MFSGCAGSFNLSTNPAANEETPIGEISGSVHGGQAPITGAQIYLFAAATNGYGKASRSLITSGKTGVSCNTSGALNGDCYVTTDSNGNFAVGGDYTCTAGTQVYMVAAGGNPGLSTTALAPVSTTATFNKKDTTITVATAAGITTGLTVTGSGVSGTVTAINGTTITLDQKTSAAGTNVPVTFSTTTATFLSGSSTITVASATNVATGYLAAGSGTGGTVTGVSGTTVTLSQQTTSTGTDAPVTFTPPLNNTAIVQMAGLGQCPTAGNMAAQVPFLIINEATTVAFAYAMSGFGSDAFHISAAASGATGLANAMANSNNIVNIQWGQARAVANGNPNSVAPSAKLYTLANIVANCVNTSSPTSSPCAGLFSVATNSAGTAPTDEATALFNIAQHQARNVQDIFNLYTGNAIFTPMLTTPPSDWTMPVIYNGLVSQPGTNGSNQIISGPFNIAFDVNGNAWIGDRKNGVVAIGPQGAATTINKGFAMVKGVAVSPLDGTIWVSDYGNNVVNVMDSTGAILTNLTSNLSGPILTAFSGNTANQSFAYEANETTTGVVLFDSAAYTVQDFEDSSHFPDVKIPGWISVDNNGVAWIPSTNTNFMGQVTTSEKGKSGKFTFGSRETNGPLSSYSMGADANGNLWFGSNIGAGDLQEIISGSTSATDIGSGGGLNGAYKIAVDGNNTIWIANANANTVSAYNGGWLAASGFSTGAPTGVGCVVAAPDSSGNLWTANADGSVTQLLGLVTPTATPIYGGVSSNSKTFAGNVGTMP